MKALSLTFALLLLGATSAVARDDLTIQTLRLESRTALIQLSGELSCTMSEENTGQPCTLRFKEAGSGRIYDLSNANAAMRLYQDGKQQVAIEGRISNGHRIEVASARAL